MLCCPWSTRVAGPAAASRMQGNERAAASCSIGGPACLHLCSRMAELGVLILQRFLQVLTLVLHLGHLLQRLHPSRRCASNISLAHHMEIAKLKTKTLWHWCSWQKLHSTALECLRADASFLAEASQHRVGMFAVRCKLPLLAGTKHKSSCTLRGPLPRI